MAGSHPRDTSGLSGSPRCGAKTRKGAPCKAPAAFGKKRCRMHGGAAGSGAPVGNRNALKHGMYTKEMKAQKARVRELIRGTNEMLLGFEKS
ncbi:MAG: HGGxSTG domain-containing protein [Betaproteobacteria bacterium]